MRWLKFFIYYCFLCYYSKNRVVSHFLNMIEGECKLFDKHACVGLRNSEVNRIMKC